MNSGKWSSAADGDDGEAAPAGGSAASALRETVRRHLRDGRIDAALQAAQHALKALPDDPAVREEFVELHLSLARSMIAEEKFDVAIKALDAIGRVAPERTDARRLRDGIEAARRQAPRRVEEARRWIEIEWFEPAFNAVRQAMALRPERRRQWLDEFLAAVSGAGDDEYLTKNFHEAFYCYDAAIRAYDESGREAPEGLVSRWMQSMTHALARDVDRAQYPPDYWKMVLRRAAERGAGEDETALLRAVLRGLAHENLGSTATAAGEYARAAGRTAAGDDEVALARAREAAIARVRGLYDADLRERRGGVWRRHDEGEWRVLEAAPFRIHHRNKAAAALVLKALRFHADRVDAILSESAELNPSRPPVDEAGSSGNSAADLATSIPCEVYLHADAEAFSAATGQAAEVRGLSIIRRRGDAVESQTIHVHQADPLLLSASLPHELAHRATAAHAGGALGAVPPALSEGLALNVEPGCRRRQFARVFAGLERPRGLKRLLEVDVEHPPEPAFYAESCRLVAMLRERGGMAGLVELMREGDGKPIDVRVLARKFGFQSAAELERVYRGKRETDKGHRGQ